MRKRLRRFRGREYSGPSGDYLNVWTSGRNRGRVSQRRTHSFTRFTFEVYMLSMRHVAVSSLLITTLGCGSNYSSPANPSPVPSPAPTPGAPSASVAIQTGAEILGNRAFT